MRTRESSLPTSIEQSLVHSAACGRAVCRSMYQNSPGSGRRPQSPTSRICSSCSIRTAGTGWKGARWRALDWRGRPFALFLSDNDCCLGRRSLLERQLANETFSEAEKQNIMQQLEQRESEYTRFSRQRMSVSDFEPLTVIGRGAFGEVRPARSEVRRSGAASTCPLKALIDVCEPRCRCAYAERRQRVRSWR